jgi:hypothetical protein
MNNLRYLANLEIALALAGWAVGLWGVWQGDSGDSPVSLLLRLVSLYPLPGRRALPPPGPVLAPHSAPRLPPDVRLVRNGLAHL